MTDATTPAAAPDALAPQAPDADAIVRRWDSLKAERATWESHWQEVLELTLPGRADVTVQTAPGAKRSAHLYDSTAGQAAEELAAGLQSAMTPRDRPWLSFRARGLDNDRGVRDWLVTARDTLLEEFAASNFYAAVHECFLDLVTVGTANLLTEEKPLTRLGFNGFAFQCVPIAEYVVDEDAQGAVDTVLRRFSLTARQAVQKFGGEALPEMIQSAARAEREQDRSFDFIHAVFPAATARPHAFASLYVSVEGRRVLRQGGFGELPYHVPRWSKSARERYGRSPAMLALPDIRTLNLIVRYGLEALPLALYPPWLVKEGTLSGGSLRLTPGAQNYWDGSPDERPTQMDWRGQVNVEIAKEQEFRARIQRALHADRLRLKDSPQMTATEVIERRQELARLVGPTVARLEAEFLTPMVERAFLLMNRAHAFGDPPAALAQASRIDIDYASPLAQAAKLHQLKALSDWYALNTPAIRANPAVLDVLDLDRIARDSADLLGLPPGFLRPPAQVAQLRQARAQVQQQAAAQDAAAE